MLKEGWGGVGGKGGGAKKGVLGGAGLKGPSAWWRASFG